MIYGDLGGGLLLSCIHEWDNWEFTTKNGGRIDIKGLVNPRLK
jgi:hypothetical protein